jgi:hypothetical protein
MHAYQNKHAYRLVEHSVLRPFVFGWRETVLFLIQLSLFDVCTPAILEHARSRDFALLQCAPKCVKIVEECVTFVQECVTFVQEFVSIVQEFVRFLQGCVRFVQKFVRFV